MATATAKRTTRTAAATKATAEKVARMDTATGIIEVGLPPVEESAAVRAAALAKTAKEDAPQEGIEPAKVQKEPIEKKSRMKIDTGVIPGKVAMALMTPDMLHDLAFISRYDAIDPQSSSPRQHGYQREPMEARFPAIGKFYAKDENRHLITPLVVSARVYDEKKQARFNFLFNRGEIAKIHSELGRDVFSIVDGQHREGGLYWAWKNIEEFDADVPVMVFYGLDYLAEAKFFDSVNSEQKRIPKALIEATLVHTHSGEDSHAQVLREVAFALAQDGDSVWKDLVNMTGKRDPEKPVTYEGVRRATGNMLPERLINRLELRNINQATAAKKYWELVAKACAPAWNNYPRTVKNESGELVEIPVKYRIKDLVGLASLSRLGQDILTTSLDATKSDSAFWDSVAALVAKLGVVDWEKSPNNPWMASPAGMAGMNHLASVLFDLVYLDQKPGTASE